MIIDVKEIKALLTSDVTGYKIGQETSIGQQTYDRYKSGKSKLSDMRLNTAIELQKFINKNNAPAE